MQLENTYIKNILHKIYYMNKFILKCYKKFIQNFIDQKFVKFLFNLIKNIVEKFILLLNKYYF